MIGLQLPQLSAADPDLFGEGGIDALGLASLAGSLADLIAPTVTDRMQNAQTRFLTVMACCAQINEELEDVPPIDGRSLPYLVSEWFVVEALCRERQAPFDRVPGIRKARAALGRGGHLDAASYLVMPSVFGYHGIFNPLARHLGILDAGLRLAASGFELAEAWEAESGFPGFITGKSGTTGARLATYLAEAIGRGLRRGRADYPEGAQLWGQLRRAFDPRAAGPRERDLLWNWLTRPADPVQRELLVAIDGFSDLAGNDRDLMSRLQPTASEELGLRFDAIDTFERVARLLTRSFESLRYLSTARGSTPLAPTDLADMGAISLAATSLPRACEEATRALAKFDLDNAFVAELGDFAQSLTATDYVVAVLARHDRVQYGRGKRPWFDAVGTGYVVRSLHRLDVLDTTEDRFVHPFRLEPLRSFVRDLRRG